MQLIYRGVTYNYDFLKASSRSIRCAAPYALSYRGVTYQVQPRVQSPTAPVETIARQLIYRGNTYWVTRTVPEKVSSQSTQPSELALQLL